MRKLFSLSCIVKIYLFIASFSFPSIALCQETYNYYTLNVNDGISHNRVYALFQDSYGYIWFGAGPNLHRFDGNKILTYSHEPGNAESLQPGNVRSIMEDSNGNLWVGTDGGGLSKFSEGKFEVFSTDTSPHSLTHNIVEQIIEMPDGSLYIATWGGGINVYKDGKFSAIMHDPDDLNSISSNNVVNLLFEEDKGILWVGTWDGGLCYIKDGKVTRLPVSEEGFNSSRARVIEKSPDGTLWVGSWGKGLFRRTESGFEQFSIASGSLENNNVLTLTAHQDQLWIGTWVVVSRCFKMGSLKRLGKNRKR